MKDEVDMVFGSYDRMASLSVMIRHAYVFASPSR